jgi:hypothetical protein
VAGEVYGRDRGKSGIRKKEHPIWSVHFLAINGITSFYSYTGILHQFSPFMIGDTFSLSYGIEAIYSEEMYGPDWMAIGY